MSSDQKRIAVLDEERISPPEESEPPRRYRCAVCKDDFYEAEGTLYENGDFACGRCEAQYVKKRAPEYYLDFACEHKEEALIAWLFGAEPDWGGGGQGHSWLNRQEKLTVAFKSLLDAVENGWYEALDFLREFCEGHEEFESYIKQKCA